MSDSVVKLRIDSSEYESKLNRAASKLLEFEEKCRKAGTSITNLDDKSLEYIQSLGQMATKATNTKSALREMTAALTDMTAIYRRLSDEEKNGGFGQELAKQIKAIEDRAASLKDTMGDVASAINAKASDTGTFDQIAGGIQGMTTAFQIGQGAAKLFGIELGDNVQVIANLQSAMAVTSGLMQAQNLLQKESAMMMGVASVQAKALAAAQALAGKETKIATIAQTAFNAVAKANPYVLLGTAVAGVGAALLGFSRNAKTAADSQQTMTDAMKEAQHMADVYNNTIQSSFASLRTKYDELQNAWNSLKNEHQRTEWIKQNQQAFHSLGLEVSNTKQAEDVFNGNTNAVIQSFVRRAQAAARVAQLTELYRKQIELLDKKTSTSAAIASDAKRSGRNAAAGDVIPEGWRSSRYGRVNQSGQWVFTEEGARLYSGADTSTAQSIVAIDRQLQANAAEIEKVKNSIGQEVGSTYFGGVSGSSASRVKGGSHTGGNTPSAPKNEYVPLAGSIDAQIAKVHDLQKAWSAASSEFERAEIKAVLDRETETLDQMRGKVQDLKNEYIPLIGSIDYQEQKVASLTAEWRAAADDDSRRRILDELNMQKAILDSMEGKEVSVKTDSMTKAAKQAASSWQDAAHAVQSVGSALQSIQDPTAKILGIIGQAVANVALGFAQATTAEAGKGIWAWIAAIAGGVGTMVSTISAIHSATGYSEGGIIKGSSFSGDNIMANGGTIGLNAGELVLNRAQQANIASQLVSSSQPSQQYAVLKGEDMVIAIRNTLRRKGRGELAEFK